MILSVKWKKYFNNADLPITFFYTDSADYTELAGLNPVAMCVIGALVKVREGKSVTLSIASVHCPAGKRFLGFSEDIVIEKALLRK